MEYHETTQGGLFRSVDTIEDLVDSIARFATKGSTESYSVFSDPDINDIKELIGTAILYTDNDWFKLVTTILNEQRQPVTRIYRFKADSDNNKITIQYWPTKTISVGATRTSKYHERIINRG